jgi:hypothetical protein
MFSKPIKGTYPNKPKMNWWNYYVGHCWTTGWQSIRHNFMTWMDLVWFEDNQKHYTLLRDDDPFDQCYIEFWFSLNDDDCYPKEFLEYLMQMVDDIETGKEKVYPLDDNFFDRIKDLTEDIEVDYNQEDLKKDMKTLEELMNENND